MCARTEVLDQVGTPVVGIVLNGVAADDSYGYSYRYAEALRQAAWATPEGRLPI